LRSRGKEGFAELLGWQNAASFQLDLNSSSQYTLLLWQGITPWVLTLSATL